MALEPVTIMDRENAAGVVLRPRFWADPCGITVRTKHDIVKAEWKHEGRAGAVSYSMKQDARRYSLILPGGVRPGESMQICLFFAEPFSSPADVLESFEPWDGHDGAPGIAF